MSKMDNLSRRQFLRVSALTAGSAVVVACGGSTPAGPAATAPVGQPTTPPSSANRP
ncbi:MAG: hypothetical protein WKH64_00380 [Chloroflexia bacterium]